MNLLTLKNAKIEKSNKSGKGYLSVIMHLAPYTISGRNVCPQASKGCAAACLNTAGYGVYKVVQDARIKRTKLFFDDRAAFMTQLRKEIAAFVKRCNKNSVKPAVRLNGTSDLKWEELTPNLFTEFSTVQFYDYTKITKRMLRYCNGGLPPNYHLTFSRSESNDSDVKQVLNEGGNVAVVFKDKLPKKWNGVKVINADDTDQRFLDPTHVICGLLAKGKGKKDSSGFVILN